MSRVTCTEEELKTLELLKSSYQKVAKKISQLEEMKGELVEKISEILKSPKDMEGTVGVKLNDKESISLIYRLNKTIDQVKVDQDIHKMPLYLAQVFKPRWELDTRKYREAMVIKPFEVAAYIVEKKAKPSVKIDIKE